MIGKAAAGQQRHSHNAKALLSLEDSNSDVHGLQPALTNSLPQIHPHLPARRFLFARFFLSSNALQLGLVSLRYALRVCAIYAVMISFDALFRQPRRNLAKCESLLFP